MAEVTTPTDYEWTLENFTDTIHRGVVALGAWSPSRRLAQQDLAERILSPYRDGANIDVAIDAAATAAPGRVNDYAMIVHELATNSVKYGALSGGGTLRLKGSVDGPEMRLTWEEGVVPSKAERADGTGFGSRLPRQTIERSLRGRFERTIDGGGMHFGMVVPIG